MGSEIYPEVHENPKALVSGPFLGRIASPTLTYPTPLIYMFLFFLQVSKEGAQSIQVFPIHKWSLKFDQGESMIGKGN